MSERTPSGWSAAKRFVLWTAASATALVWTQALAGLLRQIHPGEPAVAAASLSVASVLVAAAGVAALPSARATLWAGMAGVLAIPIVGLAGPAAWLSALALPLIGSAVTLGARWLGGRLPEAFEKPVFARRGLAVLWIAMSLASVVQMGRLSTRMADWNTDFVLTTRNPFWHTHQCLSAYLYGAELAERSESNIYDKSHYPALDRDAAPHTEIAGMPVEDPFQYPPQFLLIPKLALALSRDFETVRLGWFAAQVSLFVAVFAWLALWIRGRTGSLALWLLPGALVAFPMLHSFQFGQVHLSAIALAIAAMLAFQSGRQAGGGFLLASAILAKIFPGILLIPLLITRRFRELGWTAAWGIAITIVSLVVLGPAPFEAFIEYQMPRLANGAAFAFEQAWPELTDLVIADNQGVFGLARKLGTGASAAAWAGRVYGLLLVGIAAWAGIRLFRASREQHGTTWLALLGLASLASPGAWGDYVPSVAVWLVAMLAARAIEQRKWLLPLAITGVLQFFVLGTMPLGDWEPMSLMLPISALGALSMLGLFSATIASTAAVPRPVAARTRPSPA